MQLRTATWGFIACLALADMVAASWLWVLWQERADAQASRKAAPAAPAWGQLDPGRPVAALALDQARSTAPDTPRPAAHNANAGRSERELNLPCLLAVQAQMSASRQRSACP